MKYNPAFLKQEELLSSFVVRLADLELILETIRHNTGPSNQHLLIIGPRGSGKTSLVLRTVAEVVRDAELASKWYPIVFGEDSYEVCSAGEFWLESLFHLGEETKLGRWERTYEELRSERDEIRLRERALAQLMDFADEQGKRLLLVVENLNIILGQQMDNDAAWDLRHTLLNEPRLMLLGTATSRFEEIENAGRAMYDLFKLHDLKPLNTEDCRTMWTAITGDELSENRVRPIEILTGGNPRLLAIIANFAAKISFGELMQDLTHLVDDHTEYFKSHLDGLPYQERKVFVALADLWDPVTAREVANAARVDVNIASSLLTRLFTRGAVVVFEKKGRKKWYQVAERLYNIYHLMRRRGSPSSRIRGLVNFMILFYGDQLVDILGVITSEACKPECDFRADRYLFCGLVLQKIPSIELRERILQAIPTLFFEMPDIPSTIKELFPSMKPAPEVKELAEAQERAPEIPASRESSEVDNLIALGDELCRNPDQVQDAEKAYRDAIAIDNKSANAWASLANLLHLKTGRFKEAEAAYRKAVEINQDNAWTWFHFGQLLHEKLERYEEAEAAYGKAIELEPDVARGWGHFGQLLHEKLQRYEEAEVAYRKALALEPDVTWGWGHLGQLLHEKLERYEEAEVAYRKSLELQPDVAWGWGHLGQLLHEKLQRYEEAEAAYRKAIELEPDFAWSWVQLGQLLHEKLQRYEEAEAAYRMAIELEPDVAWGWSQLGQLLHEKLKRYEEAETAYRKAIELEPDVAWGWAQLGQLLHEKLNRYEEAETAYRKAIELKPEYAWAWTHFAQLLQKMGRFDEAEANYIKAIDLDPDYAWAWAQLGLLLEKLERFDEVEATYRKVIEINPDYYWAWAQLGQILEKLERFDDAEAAYRKTIELKPDYAWAWAQLGLLLEKLERFDEAEATYRKVIEINPGYAWAWAQLGLLLEKLERFDEAEAAYRKALELEPDNAWAGWAPLGQLLHERLERFDEAEAAYRKVIELNPDYAWTWAQLGLLLEKLERYDEAQKAYQTALELEDKNYTFWEYLINLQMQKLGDTNAALNTLQSYLHSVQRSTASLINVACTILEQHWEDFYHQAAIWMQDAINKAPEDWPLYFTLAYLQERMGNWQNALHNASQYLMHTEIRPDHIGRVTNFFIDAAAAGYPGQALLVLQKTPWASHLEPLITGLQISLGEEPTIAQEILEVGRDVAKRIEDRKQRI
jgi:tetratricopeptide (TPR) repeat protein